MENAHVADIFDEIADLLELDEDDAFRVRAYRSAARTIPNLPQRLEDLADAGGVFLEINAQPERMDLPDSFCQRATRTGVRFSIATDAHRPEDLDRMRFGVDVARRGWLERRDVLTTLTLADLRKGSTPARG